MSKKTTLPPLRGALITRHIGRWLFTIISVLIATAALSVTAFAQTVNFEAPTYTTGNINGQDGWMKTGPFDHAVSSSFGTAGFGAQSLRISNSVTSGSFGDMSFSKPTVNEAGETSATNGGKSGGIRTSAYQAQFSIASKVPGAQQPGLLMSVSPDRGDGARMSYLRFEDLADGIHVFFDDYKDLAPFGGANGDDANGCNAGGDDFTDIDIATLNRAVPHTIQFVITFVNGPRNDIVEIYIDGVLEATGTTWEDYYRFCAEQAADNNTHTVDSLLFRTSGAAVPANAGNGFLIDNLSFNSGPIPTTVAVGTNNPAIHPTAWFWYNDENDTIDNNLGSMVTGPGTPPFGIGSAQTSVSGTQRRNLATYRFSGTPLANILVMKYSTYNPSAGNGGSPNRTGYLHFNVDFNGSDLWQRRLVHLPTDNGSVIQNTWQEWDAANGSALWRYSGPTWPAGIGEPGTTLGTATKTWNQILATYPGVRMRVTDSFTGVRVGDPYADGYTENIDAFKFGTPSGVTYFNFEPVASQVYVDDNWVGTTIGTDPDAGGPATSFGYDAFATVGEGTNSVAAGGTVTVYSGSYSLSSTVNMNKAGVTIIGAGATKPVIQAASSIGDAFFVTASNVTLNNLEVQKTDLANQTLVAVQAANFTAINNLMYGPNPGAIWDIAGFVSRAFVVSNVSGTNISNNEIHTLRQPAYMSGSFNVAAGTISGNQVSGTKGWVVEGGNYTFTGNSWGEPQNQ